MYCPLLGDVSELRRAWGGDFAGRGEEAILCVFECDKMIA